MSASEIYDVGFDVGVERAVAATALVIEAQLVTTDKDFNHLNGEFLKIVEISV